MALFVYFITCDGFISMLKYMNRKLYMALHLDTVKMGSLRLHHCTTY